MRRHQFGLTSHPTSIRCAYEAADYHRRRAVLSALILIVVIVVGVGLVLILTDLVKVSPQRRANASKLATVLFLALVTWFFVVIAMSMS